MALTKQITEVEATIAKLVEHAGKVDAELQKTSRTLDVQRGVLIGLKKAQEVCAAAAEATEVTEPVAVVPELVEAGAE